MSKSISASVGKGGTNNPKDVLTIRGLLNTHKKWLVPQVISTTGVYDQKLGDAIEAFQLKACAYKTVDGRVDPNGFTLKRLNMVNIPLPRHPIFNLCYRVDTSPLTDTDYSKVAQTLSCEVEAIKAVAIVETKTSAWDSNGRPVILFERHYFRDRTRRLYNNTHPDISGQQGGYGRFSEQYPKLRRAAVLSEQSALESASWGRFQIMGSNYQAAGYTSVSDFVGDMMKNESKHLDAFANFINSNANLLDAIQKKDWAKFARYYNGSGYKKNNYDTKMDTEYKKLIQAKALKANANVTTPVSAP